MLEAQAIGLSKSEIAADELRLISRCRVGDETAMAAIIDRHRTRLIRTAANLMRDRHEAEDITQETFLKAFREMPKLRDDRAFSGYLYRICVRLCMDRLRLKRAEPSEFDRIQDHEGGTVENRVVIDKLLRELPDDLRTTLLLREIERLSYEEVAEVMHVPVGTVRSRLHTARERFRKLWLESQEE